MRNTDFGRSDEGILLKQILQGFVSEILLGTWGALLLQFVNQIIEKFGHLTRDSSVEKRDLMNEMFTEDDLKQQQRLKCAFDPKQLLNPGKVYPKLHRCAELGRVHVHKGKLPFPKIPRF